MERTTREAEALGIPVQRLVAVDLARYRDMAIAAAPMLSTWEAITMRHILTGMEQLRILAGDDSLPDAGRLAAELDSWADTANDIETARARQLRAVVAKLTPLAIAGLFFQMRLT